MSAAPAGQGHPDNRQRKGRILVVDDDRLVLATVTHGLAQAGYEVIDADNGDDAILLAREHRPALALLDIRMEGKSGFDVAETLRDAYGIPFMFLSAFADAATLAKVRELGALAYLVKPLDVGQIVPSVEAAFARIHSGQAGPGGALAPGAGAGAGSAAGAAADAGAGVGAAVGGVADAPRGQAESAVHGLPSGPAADAATRAGSAHHAALAQPLQDPVPLAIGVLMHRYSLPRDQAWAHLRKLAADGHISPQAQAERLLAALEELARTAL